MDEMNYDSMGKEALRAECREREISYSKLNNDGMRAALRADDAAHADFGAAEAEFEMSQEELNAQQPRVELSEADQAQVATEAQDRKTQPAPRATRAGLKIEANREERNGVKRPSKGGVCRQVWDYLDNFQGMGPTPPTAKDVKAEAERVGWNPNNAAIEFYQWRKFNGITGRAK